MTELNDIVWNIKYRPKKVMDVVSPYSERIKKYLENPESIPNFLFYSSTGGTGKSSMGLAIINELGCDKLMLNASADRSIDMIRNKVKEFARSKSTNGIKKCIYMDEGEKLTKDAMDALKNMIEEYASNTFYIFTTNNINKINQPMQSRFTAKYEFTKPDKQGIHKYLQNICEKEHLEYDENALNKLIDMHYPSIRTCVNTLQDLYVQGKSVTSENIGRSDDEYLEVFNMLKQQKFTELFNKIMVGEIDSENLNQWLFNNLLKLNIPLPKQIKLIQVLADNEYKFKIGSDAKIIMSASLPKMILLLKEE